MRGQVQLAQKSHRFWQFDALRGLAVFAMIVYHFFWDLNFFGLYDADLTKGGWYLFARTAAAVFVLLVGFSLKLTVAGKGLAAGRRQWQERGLKLLGLALLISLATRLFLGDDFILFGILHFIGTVFVLAPYFWPLQRWALPVGGILVGLTYVFRGIAVETLWLTPFGLTPPNYSSVDYFPLVPWLGVVFIGIGFGRLWLKQARRLSLVPTAAPAAFAPIAAVGRHSLVIYVLHQPVMLAGFWALGYTVW